MAEEDILVLPSIMLPFIAFNYHSFEFVSIKYILEGRAILELNFPEPS